MRFEEVYRTLPGHGWLTEDEARVLWDAAQRTEGSILEVGCYYGRSTVLLASLGRPIYAVDPFNDFDTDDPTGDFIHSQFQMNLASRGIQNVTLFRRKVEDWAGLQVGFAYLDGDHTYQGTLNQIAAAIFCGARRMCLHDYAQSGDGLNIAKAIKSANLKIVRVVGRMAECES